MPDENPGFQDDHDGSRERAYLAALLMNEKPKFQHPCGTCVFLGGMMVRTTLFDQPQLDEMYDRYDLYFCSKEAGGPTVLVRFDNGAENYVSSLVTISDEAFYKNPRNLTNRLLNKAAHRARVSGLIPK